MPVDVRIARRWSGRVGLDTHDLPGRPIPDALIVAASRAAGALPLATFDRGQRLYGIETRDP